MRPTQLRVYYGSARGSYQGYASVVRWGAYRAFVTGHTVGGGGVGRGGVGTGGCPIGAVGLLGATARPEGVPCYRAKQGLTKSDREGLPCWASILPYRVQCHVPYHVPFVPVCLTAALRHVPSSWLRAVTTKLPLNHSTVHALPFVFVHFIYCMLYATCNMLQYATCGRRLAATSTPLRCSTSTGGWASGGWRVAGGGWRVVGAGPSNELSARPMADIVRTVRTKTRPRSETIPYHTARLRVSA